MTTLTIEATPVDVEITAEQQTLDVLADRITIDVTVDGITTTVEADPIETTIAGEVIAPVIQSATVEIVTVADQGPPGTDGIDGASAGSAFDATNKSGSTISAGSACASHSSGVGVVLANATDDTRPAVGLAINSSSNLAVAQVQTAGPLTLADWSAVTGSATLTAKGRYYLSTTAGLLTTTPPATAGNIVQLVGVAVSDDTLDIQIWDHITL